MEYYFILTVEYYKKGKITNDLARAEYKGVFKPDDFEPRPITREEAAEIIYGDFLEALTSEIGANPQNTRNMPVTIFFSLEPNAL